MMSLTTLEIIFKSLIDATFKSSTIALIALFASISSAISLPAKNKQAFS